MPRVILFAAKTGYQVREFSAAAEALGIELVLATDRCHVLDDPWGDRAAPIRFEEPEEGIEQLRSRGPFDGVVAVGDEPARLAALAAEKLGMRFHSPDAAIAATDKLRTRERLRSSGLLVPEFHSLSTEVDPAAHAHAARYPCVLKPLHSSASRGVIRANDPEEFIEAFGRIIRIAGHGERITDRGERFLLCEEFIPGREFALDGVVTAGALRVLALFDKPDPLDGPFFEETIYVTPSREPESVQAAIHQGAQRAVQALGLSDGPIHAEMRVNRRGVWMLEVAPRPIGGLCSRVLRFLSPQGQTPYESLLLIHSIGGDISTYSLASGAHGVMMIPVPEPGVLESVRGLEQAMAVPGIEDVVITAKEGQRLIPLPEGNSYPGFLFSRGDSVDSVESSLRLAHGCLRFVIHTALPIVNGRE